MKSPSTKSSASRAFRPATLADTEHIVSLILNLNEKVGAVYGIPHDLESIARSVLNCIEHGVCLVGPTACIGGFIQPYIWNSKALIGLVTFWNFTAPSGIRIFEAMVDEFQRRGATHIYCSSHFPQNRVGDYYQRMGLQRCEETWLADIVDMTTLLNT